MNGYLLFFLIIVSAVLFVSAVLWYQPEARHAPFAAGQVWEVSGTDYSYEIVSTFPHALHYYKWQGEDPSPLMELSIADFRQLLVRSRCRLASTQKPL